MGSGRYSPDDWVVYSSNTRTKTVASEVYRARTVDDYLNPLKIKVRESRDSEANPASNAVIIALDQTGSMNTVLMNIVQKDLGIAFEEVHKRKPVSDPHIMLMTFDDVNAGVIDGCLQVSQFEAEVNPLAQQIDKFHLTNNGGSNNSESYHLPLYFAATKTSIRLLGKTG